MYLQMGVLAASPAALKICRAILDAWVSQKKQVWPTCLHPRTTDCSLLITDYNRVDDDHILSLSLPTVDVWLHFLLVILAFTRSFCSQRGVDDALLRCYAPILWRSLQVCVHPVLLELSSNRLFPSRPPCI